MTTQEKDYGWKRMKVDFGADEFDLLVGVRGARAESDLNNAQLAEKHEFGIGVPERSFVRSSFDENKSQYEHFMAEHLAVGTSPAKVSRMLSILGLKVQADIRGKIRDRIPPPLAQSTIDAKNGKDVPLIDTGQLVSAIRYTVKRGGNVNA